LWTFSNAQNRPRKRSHELKTASCSHSPPPRACSPHAHASLVLRTCWAMSWVLSDLWFRSRLPVCSLTLQCRRSLSLLASPHTSVVWFVVYLGVLCFCLLLLCVAVGCCLWSFVRVCRVVRLPSFRYAFEFVPHALPSLAGSVVLRVTHRAMLTEAIGEVYHLCHEAARRAAVKQHKVTAKL
jgi:hypothetical protein